MQGISTIRLVYLRKPPIAGAMTEPSPYITQKVAKAAGCCCLVHDSPRYVLLMPALELSSPLNTLGQRVCVQRLLTAEVTFSTGDCIQQELSPAKDCDFVRRSKAKD